MQVTTPVSKLLSLKLSSAERRLVREAFLSVSVSYDALFSATPIKAPIQIHEQHLELLFVAVATQEINELQHVPRKVLGRLRKRLLKLGKCLGGDYAPRMLDRLSRDPQIIMRLVENFGRSVAATRLH